MRLRFLPSLKIVEYSWTIRPQNGQYQQIRRLCGWWCLSTVCQMGQFTGICWWPVELGQRPSCGGYGAWSDRIGMAPTLPLRRCQTIDRLG